MISTNIKDLDPDSITYYSLWVSLGKCEMEQFGEILLRLSFLKGSWVGVSWREFWLTQDDSFTAWIISQLPKWLGVGTNAPDMSVDYDGVHIFVGNKETTKVGVAPASFVEGLSLLFRHGYVTMKIIDNETYVFPTQKLVDVLVAKIKASDERRASEEAAEQDVTQKVD